MTPEELYELSKKCAETAHEIITIYLTSKNGLDLSKAQEVRDGLEIVRDGLYEMLKQKQS